MSDFDQLIREKAEQANYHYKASAWRSFKRYAGLKTGVAALYTVVTVALLSVATFLVVKMTRHAEPAPEPPVVNTTVAMNDTVVTTEAPAEPEAATPDMPETIYCDFGGAPKAAKTDVPAVETPAPTTPATPARKTESRQAPVYGIPVVIEVDTITQMWPTDEELKEGNSRLY